MADKDKKEEEHTEKKHLNYPSGKKSCPKCGGSGFLPKGIVHGQPEKRCDKCDGEGYI